MSVLSHPAGGVQQPPSPSVQVHGGSRTFGGILELYPHNARDQLCSLTQTLTQTTWPQISIAVLLLELVTSATNSLLKIQSVPSSICTCYILLHDQLLGPPSPPQWALLMCLEVQAWSDGNTAKCKETLNFALPVFVLLGTIKLYMTTFT